MRETPIAISLALVSLITFADATVAKDDTAGKVSVKHKESEEKRLEEDVVHSLVRPEKVGRFLFKRTVKTIESPVEGISNSIRELQKKIGDLSKPIHKLPPQIKGLEEPIKGLSQPLSGLQKPIAGLTTPIKDLKDPIKFYDFAPRAFHVLRT